MRLNKRFSYFRSTDEKPPERKRNWGKYIYFLVLGLIVISVIFYFIDSSIHAEGDGQVIFDKLYIQHTSDIRVLKIFVKEGASVKRNDRLFTYAEESRGDAALRQASDSSFYSPDIEREISRTIQAIQLRELDRKGYEESLAKLKSGYDTIKNQALLDAHYPGRLGEMAESIRNTESLVAKAGEEIRIMKEYLGRIRGINATASARNLQAWQAAQSAQSAAGAKTFLALEDGVVTRIYPNDHEVVLKGDTIMEIYKPEEIAIKAFFEQEDIKHLRNGAQVSIRFPDGTRATGVIRRYYFATQPLPPEFQKRYEPVKRTVVVDIEPPNREAGLEWKQYYKLSVKVFLRKSI
ncbi:MAG: HlyD family efflux transporter periplasmic adaptor subunit [Nitrospirae bacterium]|nr:HlyD family efflux transporter periplasmic adaptor subunit [Nitrospirota bacterium]